MMIDEPEILDIKLLVSGEEDAPIELTPERYFWWHFWALWLHDALYCRWGMFSPSQARDITDRENYYNSLFGEQNRSEVLDMLDNLVDDSSRTLKRWKRYVDTRPKPTEIYKLYANDSVFAGQSARDSEHPIAGEFNREIKERQLEHYPRFGRNYKR